MPAELQSQRVPTIVYFAKNFSSFDRLGYFSSAVARLMQLARHNYVLLTALKECFIVFSIRFVTLQWKGIVNI